MHFHTLLLLYLAYHGHAVSLSLNKVLKYNFFHQEKANCNFDIKQRYNIVFQLTKTKSIFELDNYLINLKKKFQIRTKLL